MKYTSTRNKNIHVTAAQAIAQGLSEEGGLFVPEIIPTISLDELNELCSSDYRARAVTIMSKYLDDFSIEELRGFVSDAYSDNYDDEDIAPLHFLNDETVFLELWHGPTCAFKDMALQMLPRLLTASLVKLKETRKVCILVATSGDTGKAALDGFADVEGTSIAVFYPAEGVSDVQKLQMNTQTGENVFVCAVEGNFDDVQTGVKLIFGNKDFAKNLDEKGVFLSSANSINWGRLLPQIVYYFSAYCDYVNSGKIDMGDKIDFCVPTGNFGDILAAWYAKKMGLPVRKLICASNSNKVLTEFIESGVYNVNREFFTTISPSMDILVSSNLERLLFMLSDDTSVVDWMAQLKAQGKYNVGDAVHASVTADFDSGFCDDLTAKTAIAEVYKANDYLMDTHTADAYVVLKQLRDAEKAFPTVIVSTASPFKFCDSVLNAIGENSDKSGTELLSALSDTTGIEIPKPLAQLADKKVRFCDCVTKDEMAKTVLDFIEA